MYDMNYIALLIRGTDNVSKGDRYPAIACSWNGYKRMFITYVIDNSILFDHTFTENF